MLVFLISLFDKAGEFASPKKKIQYTISALVMLNTYFGAGSLFCMFSSIESIPEFCYQIIPHALIGKASWLLYVPQIKSFYKWLSCSKSQVLVISQSTVISSENTIQKEVSTSLEVNKKSVDNTQHVPVHRRESVSNVLNNDCLTASIVELAEMVNVKIAILMSIPFILYNFVSTRGEEVNGSSSDLYFNWCICVLITFGIDQFVGVAGFMGFESLGMKVDSNFSLGIENPFNPIQN